MAHNFMSMKNKQAYYYWVVWKRLLVLVEALEAKVKFWQTICPKKYSQHNRMYVIVTNYILYCYWTPSAMSSDVKYEKIMTWEMFQIGKLTWALHFATRVTRLRHSLSRLCRVREWPRGEPARRLPLPKRASSHEISHHDKFAERSINFTTAKKKT